MRMDDVGNITVKHHQRSSPMSMTFDAASRIVTALVGSVTTTFTFDDNGNQISENNNGALSQWAFDDENKMKKFTDTDGTVTTNTYDADGLRRFKLAETGGGATVATTFIWDGSDYLGEVSA